MNTTTLTLPRTIREALDSKQYDYRFRLHVDGRGQERIYDVDAIPPDKMTFIIGVIGDSEECFTAEERPTAPRSHRERRWHYCGKIGLVFKWTRPTVEVRGLPKPIDMRAAAVAARRAKAAAVAS